MEITITQTLTRTFTVEATVDQLRKLAADNDFDLTDCATNGEVADGIYDGGDDTAFATALIKSEFASEEGVAEESTTIDSAAPSDAEDEEEDALLIYA